MSNVRRNSDSETPDEITDSGTSSIARDGPAKDGTPKIKLEDRIHVPYIHHTKLRLESPSADDGGSISLLS